MSRFMVAVRAVFVVVVLAVGAVCLVGCGGDDNPSGGGGGSGEYVTLGGKKWMKKNLNVAVGESWCYEDNSSNCNTYGRLYTWESAKAACQSVGWRLPTREDWEALVTAAGGQIMAGSKLKSTNGWNNNGNGTNETGFSALPGGGYRGTDGAFTDVGDFGLWWTATEDGSGYAYIRLMGYYVDIVGEGSRDKGYRLSVRCVND